MSKWFRIIFFSICIKHCIIINRKLILRLTNKNYRATSNNTKEKKRRPLRQRSYCWHWRPDEMKQIYEGREKRKTSKCSKNTVKYERKKSKLKFPTGWVHSTDGVYVSFKLLEDMFYWELFFVCLQYDCLWFAITISYFTAHRVHSQLFHHLSVNEYESIFIIVIVRAMWTSMATSIQKKWM